MWMPISGDLGYQASDLGDIMSPSGRVLNQHWHNGQLRVRIRGRRRTVWRLVLEAFAGRPINGGYRPWHLNGNLRDNRYANLVYKGTARRLVVAPRVAHCRKDHELTGDNLKTWGYGAKHRICVTCRDG